MLLSYPCKAIYELPTDQQTSKASCSKDNSPCNITEDDLVSDYKQKQTTKKERITKYDTIDSPNSASN